MPGDTDRDALAEGRLLVEGLLRPGAYDHPVRDVHLIETHCAWVILTGDFVYKLKKPVNFGFLDYSTLEKRRFYCEEEIRLNRRFAPAIYLDVVPVTGERSQPRIGGSAGVLEYAVRMRQFPEGGLLSQLAAAGQLQAAHIDQLIECIGSFHRSAARAAADSDYGDPQQVYHWVSENFNHIRAALPDAGEIARLERVERWVGKQRVRLEDLFLERKRNGCIRECHGDLHLGNITLIDGRVTPFDCIEFNPELRWIDVFSEVAFLLMDLDDRGYRHFDFRFLNGYLQREGDYQGLGVLSWYKVYRALVRAKVAMLRRQQAEPGGEVFGEASEEYHQYMVLAEGYIDPPRPRLLITRGLSGSGKSTLARQLCEQAGMIQLRSDVERKRLAGLDAGARSGSGVGSGLYTADRTARTYRRLAELARQVLQAGYSVIADASFLQRSWRDLFRDLAAELDVPFVILDCEAPVEVLEQRIGERMRAGADPSEATLEVLHHQLQTQQPLADEERPFAVRVDTQLPDCFERVIEALPSGGSG